MSRSEVFIDKYSKVLVNGCEFVDPDRGFCLGCTFDTAAVRWLVIFPSSSFAKDMSMTATVLLDWVERTLPYVYIDFAYLPCREDVRWYDKEYMPYALGINSHLDASHFDVVGFSVSCLYEIPAVAWCIHSFSRCDRPIPVAWSERRLHTLGDYPVVYVGGASVLFTDALFGTFAGGVSFMDFAYLGECWDEVHLFELLRSRGACTVDGVVEKLWSKGYLCYAQPQRYTVERLGCRIVSDIADGVAPAYMEVCSSATRPEGLVSAARGYIRGSGGNYKLAQVQLGEGCGYAGNCSFCAEGWLSGGLREVSGKDVDTLLSSARVGTAADTVKLASYNLNYVTDWKSIVRRCGSYFTSVNFSNMRMGELADDVEGMDLCFSAGFRRAAAPIEGISPRIRNGYYNKGLSDASLDRYMEQLLHRGCLDIKIGVVLCGLEDDSDWEWLYAWASRWQRAAALRGGKLPLRFQCTPLVVYPGTPLEYTDKAAARIAYEGGMLIPRAWYIRFTKELGVRMELNYYTGSTFHEQVLISLGRSVSGYLFDVIHSGTVVYNLRSLVGTSYDAAVRALVASDMEGFFGGYDPSNSISVLHRLRTPLDYVKWVQTVECSRHGLSAQPTPRCMQSGTEWHCVLGLLGGGVYRRYGDVRLSEGVLTGEVLSDSKGCGACKNRRV